jgi:hypothetical protein
MRNDHPVSDMRRPTAARATIAPVIAGLDPAIHLLRKRFAAKKMGPRVKPAGDGGGRGEY